MLGKYFSRFCQCPIAGIILFRFPFAVRAAIHELRHEEIAHVLAGMLLSEEMSRWADRRDGVEGERFIVDFDSLHHLANDRKDFAIHHHFCE